MNRLQKKISEIGIVPVVKIEDEKSAAPLAHALTGGGIPCAEVTFRTNAAPQSIKAMRAAEPEMIVGAGTVLTVEQADQALAAGAQFIVAPGFNPTVVDHCLSLGVTVMPGVSSASEVEQCLERGLDVVKFFPAEPAGGLAYLKALAGPYPTMRFMPTGGINPENLAAYTTDPRVLACGGTWMVGGSLIADGRFDEIGALCRQAVRTMLGFKLAHIGINAKDADEARATAQLICDLFGFELRDGASLFCDSYIEVLKEPYLGTKGHIAISTIDIDRAVANFKRRGIAFDPASEKRLPDGRLNAIYLADEIAGYAVHLVRA